MKPTAIFQPFGGAVTILLFGRPHNWSIKDRKPEILEAIGETAAETGIKDVYAPVPTDFNALVCDASALLERWELGSKVTMWRGVRADGVAIPSGSGAWLSTADCPVIVVQHDNGKIVVAHAGRDSLIDRKMLSESIHFRPYFSVVQAAVAHLTAAKRAAEVQVFIGGGIGPELFTHSWDDPRWGGANLQLTRFVVQTLGASCLQGKESDGRLVLSEIIRQQCLRVGILPHRIGLDLTDTARDKDGEGQYRWWSHRRGDSPCRNGVFVVRHQ